TTLSKHQNRFTKGVTGSPLRELCTLYERALERNGIERFKKLPYAFSEFSDGTPVPDAARHLIRTDSSLEGIDYFNPDQCVHIHNELNRPVVNNPNGLVLTALAVSLWQSREDLRNAFPAIESVDGVRFAQWLLDAGNTEAGFSEIHLQPIRRSLELMRNAVGVQSERSRYSVT